MQEAKDMFKEVSTDLAFSQREKRIMEFWRENDTFRKSLLNRENFPAFVFYEGPPTANGMPTIAHTLARTMKDLVCRYKTMTGHYVSRKAGWVFGTINCWPLSLPLFN